MSINKALLAVALLSFSTASFATRTDLSDTYIPNIDFTNQDATTGEPIDAYLVKIDSNDRCCLASVLMDANVRSTAKFGMDDYVFDVKINRMNESYKVSVFKTNTLTNEVVSAELAGTQIGNGISFSFDDYSVNVAPKFSAQ